MQALTAMAAKELIPMFPIELVMKAQLLVGDATDRKLRFVTAESCTGGLLAGLLTSVPGSSSVLDRGFVTYSNAAKSEMLDVPGDLIADAGAVSEAVARSMAEGALHQSRGHISVAITGVAGPGGGTPMKPVGLVHFAAARQNRAILHEMHRFGEIGRDEVRLASLDVALDLLRRQF
jgi:nicotinamide-nucleotide amidase